MSKKCTECGAAAVKEEDYALFDYIYDVQNRQYTDVEFAGIIRISMCKDCINEYAVSIVPS